MKADWVPRLTISAFNLFVLTDSVAVQALHGRMVFPTSTIMSIRLSSLMEPRSGSCLCRAH